MKEIFEFTCTIRPPTKNMDRYLTSRIGRKFKIMKLKTQDNTEIEFQILDAAHTPIFKNNFNLNSSYNWISIANNHYKVKPVDYIYINSICEGFDSEDIIKYLEDHCEFKI